MMDFWYVKRTEDTWHWSYRTNVEKVVMPSMVRVIRYSMLDGSRVWGIQAEQLAEYRKGVR